ncbi:type II secretion system protein [Thiomicrorhabdus sediminis]|uniref:type II secretion system protein n=1 Tax=Thiomicrorhabdus sediminis TaxID=2580412 RepID=UPI00143D7410|nr:prepilin-type N-terminal cleavage/methylation domain-containing protein [Thiomicrorhabdus sediminis]
MYQAGFSLLEISVALVVLSVLSFGLVNVLKLNQDYEDFNNNRLQITQTKQALLVFAQSNGYLPCPDSDGNGLEDRSSGVCDVQFGRLPFLMLGLPETDVFGNSIFYAVNADAVTVNISDGAMSASYFSDVSAPRFTLQTVPLGSDAGTGNYTVCDEAATECNASTPVGNHLVSSAIAVIMSFGANGAQTWATNASNSSIEVENADDDQFFWQARRSQAYGAEFDDQLAWIGAYELKFALLKTENGLAE